MPIYMKFDPFIKGEVTDKGHEGEIEILSFSWGLSQATSTAGGGGGGTGKASFQDMHFETPASSASPLLAKACASGEHFKKATLTVRKAGNEQQEYYKVNLEDVLVSSFQSAGAGDVRPEEAVSLNFGKIMFEYDPVKADGSLDTPIVFSWDIARNAAG
jgi:type VI secretion system secreted protein Hcp